MTRREMRANIALGAAVALMLAIICLNRCTRSSALPSPAPAVESLPTSDSAYAAPTGLEDAHDSDGLKDRATSGQSTTPKPRRAKSQKTKSHKASNVDRPSPLASPVE